MDNKKNIILGVIYRPPNTDINVFNDKLDNILDTINKEGKLCYIMGDYNINILNSKTHQGTNEFVNMMSSYAFVPLISRPTRVTADSATLIDNIFTNDIVNFGYSLNGVLVSDISDHYPVFHINRECKLNECETFMYRRVYNQQNKQAFLTALEHINWDEVHGSCDTQSSFNVFHNCLTGLLNKHFPIVRIKKRYNNRKPWLTDALRQSIKRKNKLYSTYKRLPCVRNELNYKTYKCKLQNVLRHAEKRYYHELLVKYSGDSRKSWSIIKDIINKNQKAQVQTTFRLNDGGIISDKSAIANRFNEFFTNVGPTLAKCIPKVDKEPKSYLCKRIQESLYLAPVSLKNSASGYDDISPMLLKTSINHISVPLSHICNLSLTEGVYPDNLKLANVVPLFKADDCMLFNNYRPVSILCVFSKVFEKIMFNRLQKFLNDFNILYKNQFGFRINHSTHMAHIVLMDKIVHALENGESVIGLYLDFSKAFDTVNHAILLDKLEHYGIRGNALSWFKSYLTNRRQFVTYNNIKSAEKIISCGVPQGSILGPLLFLIYINDLANVCVHTLPILFADDTNLFISGKNLNDMAVLINYELEEISTWLKANRLSLNVKKTHFMVFSKKHMANSDLQIEINGEIITRCQKTKFLGVIIDEKVTWREHINYISGKVSKGIGIIIKARKVLHKQSLANLYYSFIYPYLIFCNHVWGNACKSHMHKLLLLQKKIVRIIAGVQPRCHTDPLFSQMKLLKADQIHKYLIGRLMFKVYHRDLDIFQDYFSLNSDIHDHSTRQTDHYHVPFYRTEMRKHCLRYCGAEIWNKILVKKNRHHL